MAGFGIGFGTGLMGGLSKNIEQEEQRRLLQAQLHGDILGLEAEAGETSSVLPTTTEPRSALTKLGGAFGLVKTPTERLEGLLERRGMLRGQAARKKEMQATFKSLLDAAAKGAEIELTPELRKRLGPYALILDAQLQKVRQREAAKRRLNLGLAEGVTEERERAFTEETDIGDVPLGGGIERTTRPMTRGETAGMAIEAGYGDKIIDNLLAQPKDDPRFRIQPAPGSPARSINERTGEITTYPGTERPSPSADPVMNRYRQLRNERMERQNKGVLAPKDEVQMLAREIQVLQSRLKEANEDERAGLEALLRQTFFAWNRARANLRTRQPGQSATPTPTPTPGGGGGKSDPLGIR